LQQIVLDDVAFVQHQSVVNFELFQKPLHLFELIELSKKIGAKDISYGFPNLPVEELISLMANEKEIVGIDNLLDFTYIEEAKNGDGFLNNSPTKISQIGRLSGLDGSLKKL